MGTAMEDEEILVQNSVSPGNNPPACNTPLRNPDKVSVDTTIVGVHPKYADRPVVTSS